MVWVGFNIPARRRTSLGGEGQPNFNAFSFEVCTFKCADFSVNCWGPSVLMWQFFSLNHYQAMNTNLKQDGPRHFWAKKSIQSYNAFVHGPAYKFADCGRSISCVVTPCHTSSGLDSASSMFAIFPFPLIKRLRRMKRLLSFLRSFRVYHRPIEEGSLRKLDDSLW